MTLAEYYRKMDTAQMLAEFEDLIRKWKQGFVDANGYGPHEALTAIWFEADRRGIQLPTCRDFPGVDRDRLGSW